MERVLVVSGHGRLQWGQSTRVSVAMLLAAAVVGGLLALFWVQRRATRRAAWEAAASFGFGFDTLRDMTQRLDLVEAEFRASQLDEMTETLNVLRPRLSGVRMVASSMHAGLLSAGLVPVELVLGADVSVTGLVDARELVELLPALRSGTQLRLVAALRDSGGVALVFTVEDESTPDKMVHVLSPVFAS